MSAAANAVFVSYASQDAEAVRKIADSLRGAGVEVWFDKSALVGGDAWDQKIRQQIKECALFVPVISAATQARREGYFRLEWKLAAQRTHTMADGTPFILPVVIDATRDTDALVPEEFRAVQWTRLPDGETSAAFCERVSKLLGGDLGARSREGGTASVGNAGGTPAVPGKSPRRWLGYAIALLATAIALAIWLPSRKTAPTASANPEPKTLAAFGAAGGGQAQNPKAIDLADAKSIAVLAFANMSPEKDTEYFSDGISEEILNALDRNPLLRVTPRTSSFSFKGRNVPLDEIGRALRVSSVIEGSVRKDGNKVRIMVKLFNAADGTRIWAEEFNREMTDIFALQSEIAGKVAQKLSGDQPSAPAAPAGAQTRNLAAYDLYLRGRAAQLAWAISSQAVTLFEEAVELDPNYALAWARLAQALDRLRLTTNRRTEENISRARAAAAKALQLSPSLPEAHLAFAAVERDHDAVQRALDIVERLRPGDAELLAARANLEYSRGNWGSGFPPLVLRAVERDPQNFGMQSLLGRALSNAGWFGTAHPFLEVATTRPASLDAVRNFWVLVQNTLRWTGDLKAALAYLERTPQDARNSLFFSLRAGLHLQTGDRAAALADCERIGPANTLPTGGNAHRHPQAYSQALIESSLGRTARAAELFADTLAIAQRMESDPVRFYALVPALVKARLGKQAEAIAELEAALRPGTEPGIALLRAFVLQTKAEVLAVVGRSDEAVATLRTVHDMGYGFGYTLRLDLEWEPLRGNAKFQQLMTDAEARADAQPRPRAGRAPL